MHSIEICAFALAAGRRKLGSVYSMPMCHFATQATFLEPVLARYLNGRRFTFWPQEIHSRSSSQRD